MIKEFIKKCFELKGVRILFWIALLFFTIDCLGVIFASIDAVFLTEYSGYDIANPFSIVMKAFELTWHEEASDSESDIFGAMVLYLFCATVILPLIICCFAFSKIKAFILLDKISAASAFFISLFYAYSLVVIILTRADLTWLGHLFDRSNFNFSIMIISALSSLIIASVAVFILKRRDKI
nr:hypothetical protein [uncultured Campylobacter sp.]